MSPARLARGARARGRPRTAPAPSRGGARPAVRGATSAALERLGRLDGEQRAVRALDALRRSARAVGRARRCCSTASTTSPAAARRDRDARRGSWTRAVTVSLAYEPGRDGVRRARARRSRRWRRSPPSTARCRPRRVLRAARARRARTTSSARCSSPTPRASSPAGAVRLLEGGGERAELELVRARSRALLDAGMPPEEIAVVHRAPRRERRAARGGVRAPPASPTRCSAAAASPTPRSGGALLGLLRCVPAGAGDAGGELGDLLAWLRAPGPARAPRAGRPARADGAAHGRAERRAGAARCGRSATGRWTRSTSSREAAAARAGARCSSAPTRELERLFAAPRRGARERARARTSWTRRARSRRAAARSPSCASWRAARAGARAGATRPELARGARARRAVQRRAPRRRGRWRCSTRSRCARGACGRCSCAACRRACSRRAPRPQPLLAEEERRRLAEASGLRLGEQRGRARGRALPALRGRLAPARSCSC